MGTRITSTILHRTLSSSLIRGQTVPSCSRGPLRTAPDAVPVKSFLRRPSARLFALASGGVSGVDADRACRVVGRRRRSPSTPGRPPRCTATGADRRRRRRRREERSWHQAKWAAGTRGQPGGPADTAAAPAGHAETPLLLHLTRRRGGRRAGHAPADPPLPPSPPRRRRRHGRRPDTALW